MKKFAVLVMLMGLLLGLSGCGQSLETENVTVDGIYIDDSYASDSDSSTESSIKRMVFPVTLHPTSQAVELGSNSNTITLEVKEEGAEKGEVLTPSFDLRGYTAWMPSYYHDDAAVRVDKDNTQKIAIYFEVPPSMLSEDKEYVFSISGLSSNDEERADEVSFGFDDIQHVDNMEALAEKVDPDGYKEAKFAREDAPEDVAKRVKEKLDGNTFNDTIKNSDGIITIKFSKSAYNIGILGYTTGFGTYEVKNGFLLLTNNIGKKTWMPYKETSHGTIDIEISEAAIGTYDAP